LQLIQQTLGFGKIYSSQSKTEGILPCFRIEVDTKENCKQLCDVFSTFPLRAKKARDFVIWKAAVSKWSDAAPSGGRSPDKNKSIWNDLEEMRFQLQETRRFKENGGVSSKSE
jgi:hypothetical protein